MIFHKAVKKAIDEKTKEIDKNQLVNILAMLLASKNINFATSNEREMKSALKSARKFINLAFEEE